MSHLTDDIRTLRGVGEKKAQLFHKLGLFTLGDCLEHFPREYEDRSRFYPSALGKIKLAFGRPASSTRLIRKGLSITKLRAFDESDRFRPINPIRLSCARRNIFSQMEGILRKTADQPQFEPAGRGMIGRLLPVYRLTGGAVPHADAPGHLPGHPVYSDELTESLDEEIRQQYDLCHIRYASEKIHYPVHREALKRPRNG